MQKNKKRKGFTLTELAIVIAVIAILIAVLVPTFISLIDKANESADKQTVKNLNSVLSVDEAINGTPANINEALAVTEAAGYKVENLTPASDSSLIVWNETDNQFEYVKADELSTTYTSNQSTIWLITSSYDKENADFSQYISGTITEDLTVSAGISVGSNSDINISYEDNTEESVTFVTNGGTLTLNNANATVTHYGTADTVNVEAVDENNSYHLNGIVENINVTKGHVVIETNAEISTIIVSSSNVTIEINSSSEITVATDKSELVDTLSNIISGNKSNITVVDQVSDEIAVKYFAGGLGTEEYPYEIATAQQFANINKLTFDTAGYYFKQTADIAATTYIQSFSGVYDGGGNDFSVKYKTSSNWSYMIYEIAGHATVKNLTVEMNGIGVSLFCCADYGTAYGIDVDNITFNSNTLVDTTCSNYGLIVINALYTPSNTSVEYNFTNITNNANIQNNGTCTGFIIGSGPCFNGYAKLNYENCVNNGTITGTQTVGFLYGNYSYIVNYGCMDENDINVSNCTNNGTFMSTSTGAVVTFAPKLDTVEKFSTLCSGWETAAGGTFMATNYFTETGNGYNGVYQVGSIFTIDAEDDGTTYKLVLSVSAEYFMPDGEEWNSAYESDLTGNQGSGIIYVSNGTRYYADLTSSSEVTTAINSFYAYDIETAIEKGIISSSSEVPFTNGYAIVVIDGVNYMIIDTDNSYYINSSVTAYVYAYNADGNLIGIKTL